MFLSKSELIELTDRSKSKLQIAWLSNNGYRFDVGAAGRAKVLQAEVDRKLLGGVKRQVSPNFEHINGPT